MYQDFLVLRMNDVFRHLQADDVVGNVPVELLAVDGQTIRLIEGPDDLFIALETKGAKEDRRQEFALPVDPYIKDVLRRFVFEFDPRPAIRNDFAEEVALARSG